MQRVQAAALGGGPGDRVGIYQSIALGASQIGRPYNFSAYLRDAAGGTCRARLYIDWYNSGAVLVDTTASSSLDVSSGTMRRFVLSGVVPPAATSAVLHVWEENNISPGTLRSLELDWVQFQIGEVLTDYAPRADEILNGAVDTPQLAPNAATEFASTSNPGITVRIRTNTGATLTPPYDVDMAGVPFWELLTLVYTNTTGEDVEVEATASYAGQLRHGSGTSGSSYGYMRVRLSALVGGTEFGEATTIPEVCSAFDSTGDGVAVSRSPALPLIVMAPGDVLTLKIEAELRWKSGTPTDVGDLTGELQNLAIRYAALIR